MGFMGMKISGHTGTQFKHRKSEMFYSRFKYSPDQIIRIPTNPDHKKKSTFRLFRRQIKIFKFHGIQYNSNNFFSNSCHLYVKYRLAIF